LSPFLVKLCAGDEHDISSLLLCFSLFSLLFLYFTTKFRASACSQAASQACFAPHTSVKR
jgi:hypothetical protein